MSMSGLLIPEEFLSVISKSLEIARATSPGAIGDSATEVLEYIQEAEDDEHNEAWR